MSALACCHQLTLSRQQRQSGELLNPLPISRLQRSHVAAAAARQTPDIKLFITRSKSIRTSVCGLSRSYFGLYARGAEQVGRRLLLSNIRLNCERFIDRLCPS